MQVTCSCFDWAEVRKRSGARAVLDEMLMTDDIDLYEIGLPDELWKTDSANLHFEVARALPHLVNEINSNQRPHLEAIMSVISSGASLDELGLSPLTGGCYFFSISPETVGRLLPAFEGVDIQRLGMLCAEMAEPSLREELPNLAEHLSGVLEQWRDALRFARDRKLGLIGHCG